MSSNPLAKQFTPAAVLKFAVPNVVMMVFLSLYVIIDGMFISRLVSEVALSSINMYFPVVSMELAVGIMLSTGGSAVIAAKMGMGNAEEAREDFTCINLVALIIGLLFIAVCLPLLDPILTALGTSDLQMHDARMYAIPMLLFSPIMFFQTIFQVFFVTAGKPHLGLILTVCGGVTNIVLDYLFMGPMGMGTEGAGIATGIGYCIPAVVGILYFTFNRKGTLYYVKFTFRPRMLLKTCANGSSEMVVNAATAVTTFLFNIIFMDYWAENGVATITILLYFQFVFMSIFLGFSMGIAPLISFKFGAGDFPQLKRIFRFGVIFILLASAGVYIVSMLTVKFSVAVFTDPGSPVYELAMRGFRFYALQFLLMGISIYASAMFTALGNGIVSAAISIARTFIFLVGSLLILPHLWGEYGVWFAVPVAELLGVFVSISFLLWGRKRYRY